MATICTGSWTSWSSKVAENPPYKRGNEYISTSSNHPTWALLHRTYSPPAVFKMSSWSLKLFTTLIAFIGQAFAVINANISADALSACHALQAVYPNQVVYNALDLNPQKDYDYEQATQRYWSMANADNIPACVFLPETANMTAFAVQVLNKYTSVPWAVKGGGHNPNVGFSSTAGGILLAMENFANTTLDAQGLAHVGPGARWVDALTVLDTYGKAIVGGRLGMLCSVILCYSI